MNLAFLGLGNMGLPMARNLHRAGHALTVWNRTASKAEELLAAGVTVAVTIADAVGDRKHASLVEMRIQMACVG